MKYLNCTFSNSENQRGLTLGMGADLGSKIQFIMNDDFDREDIKLRKTLTNYLLTIDAVVQWRCTLKQRARRLNGTDLYSERHHPVKSAFLPWNIQKSLVNHDRRVV